jgi:hypothetical protein
MTLDVLLPLKFDHPFTYNVPKDISVRVGDFRFGSLSKQRYYRGRLGQERHPLRAQLRLKI